MKPIHDDEDYETEDAQLSNLIKEKKHKDEEMDAKPTFIMRTLEGNIWRQICQESNQFGQ